MRNPCYECEKRKLGCHDKCKDYKTWKMQYTARDKGENEYLDYVMGAIDRMKGNGRWG